MKAYYDGIHGIWNEMKFQKGLLDDLKDTGTKPKPVSPSIDRKLTDRPAFADQDRLFQTHQRTDRTWRQYLSMLMVITVLVIAGGGLAFYLTLPKPGDQVRPPRGLEAAVRAHFLDVEKRASGDIVFFYCENFYWARVEVEKRPDIKTNPVYQIGSYAARAVPDETEWQITAVPITSQELNTPCG